MLMGKSSGPSAGGLCNARASSMQGHKKRRHLPPPTIKHMYESDNCWEIKALLFRLKCGIIAILWFTLLFSDKKVRVQTHEYESS